MRSVRITRVIVFWLSVLLATGCSGESHGTNPLPNGTLLLITEAGPIPVMVEIADTAETRARGLMGRTSLGPDAGMVFLFDDPSRSRFWMKDTLIPLSIAFWGPDGRIVGMLDMVPCLGDPCRRYDPGVEYVGALEVNVGFFRDRGVAIGDAVQLER